MINIKWYINRFKTMSIGEIIWRLNQKCLQKKEEKLFYNKQEVTCSFFNKKLKYLSIDIDKLYLNNLNNNYSLNSDIELLGDFEYENYKNKWSSGFQTDNYWPNIFSYKIKYKGCDQIGDARCNWELNRHYQFVKLAKNYYITRDKKYLKEFKNLFYDWNKKNPFLYGISWTSVMEVAIRCNNWCYMYYFLKNSHVSNKFLRVIEIGIVNMTDYITKHYSRYSSANNHLIVEAYAILQSGILFDYNPWIKFGINTLTNELGRQNYIDGINKEMSLHYQAFYMETMGLAMRLLIKNKIKVPDNWYNMLDKMCIYLKSCIGKYNEVMVFGDDDQGKILDLGGKLDYYNYVLGLYGYLLDNKYVTYNCENLNWLFTLNDKKIMNKKDISIISSNRCYHIGGVSLISSNNKDLFIGIDHGNLGFGKIAAHGHADCLSFQLYYKGHPVFVDLGTYLYHCDGLKRDFYRKTINHNTVSINNNDQSQILGSFLWGKKAKATLIKYEENKNNIILIASHNGYNPIIHTRKYIFNKKNKLEIIDTFNKKCNKVFNLNFAPNINLNIINNKVEFENKHCKGIIIFDSIDRIKVIEKMYFSNYGIEEKINSIECSFCGLENRVIVTIEEV